MRSSSSSLRRSPLLFLLGALALPAALSGCESCGPPVEPTPTQLAFIAQPQGAQAGQSFTPAVQVAVQDRTGATITSSTAQVTIALRANPTGAPLGGTLTATAVNGVATFADLSVNTAGQGYALVASSTGLAEAVSDPFAISAGPATQLAFGVQPTDLTAGNVIAPAVTVGVRDAFNNAVLAVTQVTVALGTNPSGGTLSGTTTASTFNGVATFADLSIDREGDGYTLSASSGTLRAADSSPFRVLPGPATALAFTVQPSDATAGQPIAPAVQVSLLDARGNVARGAIDPVTISFDVNAGGGTLSGTLTRNAVNGVATFADLSIDRAAAGYRLRAASGTLAPAVSSAFAITAGAAAGLAFTIQPSAASAGSAISPAVEVTIIDASGNRTGSTASVTVALGNNPSGATLSGTLTRAAVAGVATFNDLRVDRAGAGYTLAASSAGLAGATSASFDVTASTTPTQLAFRVQPSNAQAGAAIAPPVEVVLLDQFGNRTSSTANVTVALATNPGASTLSGTTTVAAVAGVATFPDLSLNRAASGYTLRATSGALTPAVSAAFTIAAGPPAALTFQQPPTDASAGAAIAPAVQVAIVDSLGNVTGAGSTVTVALAGGPGGATLQGTLSQTAAAGVASFPDLSITLAGAGYTLRASSGALPAATSSAFTIRPGPASQLAFTTQPSNTAAGAAITPAVRVSVTDAFGNQTTSTAVVTVALGNNPSGGTLSGTTSQAAVSGVATFATLSIDRTGAGYTLQASAPALTGATSAGFDIAAGAPNRLAFLVQPSTTTAGATIGPAVEVAILDSFGNTTSSSATVSIAIGNNPSGGTLSGVTMVAASAGVATFSGLSIDRAGTGYTLQASSAGLTGATSAAFNITGGAPTQLSFRIQPTPVGAGSPINPAVEVAILDAQGNPTSSTASVTIAIGNNPGGSTLGGTATRAAVAGVATFSDLTLNRTGTGYTLTAASAGLTGATSSAFDVAPGPASQLAFTVQPSSAVAGAAVAPAVQVSVLDALGNLTGSTATITVALANNPGGGTLSGTVTRTAAAGVASFNDLSINRTGTGYTLRATATGLAAAVSAGFDITPGPATQLAFTVQPSNAAAGATVTPAVQVSVLDALGNVTASTANVTVAFSANPTGATLNGTLTRAAVAGVATFNDLSTGTAGTGYTLAASSAGLTGTISSTFNVTAAAPSQLAFGTQPSNAVAGQAISPAVTVRILDAFGNLTSSTATVAMAIGANPGGGTLGGTTSVAASGGVASFLNLSIDRTGAGYTLQASSAGLAGATSSAFDITPAAAAQLAYGVQPSNATAGSAIAPAVTVRILDAFGNQTGSTANVSVAIGNNPGGGVLSGTLTRAAAAGVATFNDLSIDRTGAGYTLAASSAGLAGATSNAFDIAPGPATQLVYLQQPSTTPVNSVLTPAVRVAFQDALGNIVTSATAPVTVALQNNPGGGTLGGTLTQNAVAGVAAFADLTISQAGTGYTLIASGALLSVLSAAFDITSGVTGLVYTDPPAGGRIRLVRNAASTPTTVVLDLVAAVPLTGYHVGFNLPLDTTRVQASATLMSPGTALPAGSAPIAARAGIPATGPLANVLVSGQSQKAAGAGAVPGDSAVPAGAVFYTLRLDLRATATPGVVFDGAALPPQFSGRMRDKIGTDVAVPADFRIGRLEVF